MTIFRKAAASLAVLSVATMPIAATAASGMRATSASANESSLEGNSSWVIGLIGLLAGITAIVLVLDDDKDSPTSP